MRTFEEQGKSIAKPVKVLIENDELELPEQLNELQVFLFNIRDSSGAFQVYREGDTVVCFAKEDDALQKTQNPNEIFSVKLRFLILACQRERITNLIVR